jgi:hypothetical protein
MIYKKYRDMTQQFKDENIFDNNGGYRAFLSTDSILILYQLTYLYLQTNCSIR